MMVACDCTIVVVRLAGDRYCESLDGGTVEHWHIELLLYIAIIKI